MSLHPLRAACLLAAVGVIMTTQTATAHRRHGQRAPGAPHLGAWIEEGWRRADWSRAPAVRDWDFSAPATVDPSTGDPSSTAEYPWGYTTPFVRVGRKCVASELNAGLGGDVVRYQRVMPAYYCR